MLIGAHLLLYSEKPETDRAFFRDILGLPFIDAGGGWLIFKLPSSELAVHPAMGDHLQLHGGRSLLGAVLYLMVGDLSAFMQSLAKKGVSCSAIEKEPWGTKTTIRMPSGGEIGLYQPTQPTALDLKSRNAGGRSKSKSSVRRRRSKPTARRR